MENYKLAVLKAKEEARKQQRNELKNEMEAHSLSRKDVDKKWQEAMMRTKEPVFRKNIEVMRQTFERTMDKKDHLIDLLLNLKSTADGQYRRTVYNFCDIVDNAIKDFQTNLETMSKQNNIKIAELLKKNKDEIKCLSYNNKNTETHIQMLLHNTGIAADFHAWSTKGENMVEKDEETKKYLEARQDICSLLENNYNDIWDEYKSTLKSYISCNYENQKQVRKLRTKENKMDELIASQAKKMITDKKLVKHLQNELESYKTGSKQNAFRARRERNRTAYYILKASLFNGIDTDAKQLEIMVNASQDSIDWLDAASKKGEKILRVAALCRKFETQREKVLPFEAKMQPTSRVTERQKHFNDPIILSAVTSTATLTRLWEQISKVELAKKALHREKMLLQHENAVMMRRLQEGRLERNEKKVSLDAFQCRCTPETSTSFKNLICAVDGTFETKKVLT